MHTAIDTFVTALAAVPVAADSFNQYAPPDPNNAIRRHNLTRYLTQMLALRPPALLLMEAPGYRGCRLTGIPVTSRVMLTGAHPMGWFGVANGYQLPEDAGFEDVRGEQTSTIVWTTLAQLNVTPLIWSSYPFHPHQPDNPRSNRPPRKAEVALGRQFVGQIAALFTPQIVVAVGNVAVATLSELGIAHHKVRHPAQGGKNDFVAGMTALFGGTALHGEAG